MACENLPVCTVVVVSGVNVVTAVFSRSRRLSARVIAIWRRSGCNKVGSAKRWIVDSESDVKSIVKKKIRQDGAIQSTIFDISLVCNVLKYKRFS